MEILVLLGGLVALDIAAHFLGHDSREMEEPDRDGKRVRAFAF